MAKDAREFVLKVLTMLDRALPGTEVPQSAAQAMLALAKDFADPQPVAPVLKVDEDKQLVYGWASVWSVGGRPVVDKQGDVMFTDDVRDAAHGFMKDARTAGEMHALDGVGTVVESVLLDKGMQDALGIDLGMEGWWIGVKVDNPEVWAKVKNGTYRAFSIGGVGTREPWTGDESTAISQLAASKMMHKPMPKRKKKKGEPKQSSGMAKGGGCKYGCPPGKCSKERHMKAKRMIGKALSVLDKFSANQPRDDIGRWTDTGGGGRGRSGGGAKKPAKRTGTKQQFRDAQRHLAAEAAKKPAKKAPAKGTASSKPRSWKGTSREGIVARIESKARRLNDAAHAAYEAGDSARASRLQALGTKAIQIGQARRRAWRKDNPGMDPRGERMDAKMEARERSLARRKAKGLPPKSSFSRR